MEMTMRQVSGLLKVINRSDLVEFYNRLLSYSTVHGAKLCSLDEFLALSSGNSAEPQKAFDETTDKTLEEIALKRLAERQAQRGQ